MKNPRNARSAWMAGLLLSAGLAHADVTETEEMTYDVAPDVRISLENVNGGIVIEGGNTRQVRIVATKKADSQEVLDGIEINIEASADAISIDTELPKSDGGWFSRSYDSGSVSYRLEVPHAARLDAVTSVNGDIEIEGVRGEVKSETVNGSVSASGLQGDGSFETVNGGIEAQFDVFGGNQRLNAEAVNGRIEIDLPEGASARVAAETVNGSIDASDFGLEADKGFVGRDLSGTIGSGEGRISVDTVNGSIKLRKR